MVVNKKKSLTALKEEIESFIGKKFFYQRESIDLTTDMKKKAENLIEQTKEEINKGVTIENTGIARKISQFGIGTTIKEIITLDGLKIVFEDAGWFCIRLSGTEDVARIYTEGLSEQQQKELLQLGKRLLGVEVKEFVKEATLEPEIVDNEIFMLVALEEAQESRQKRGYFSANVVVAGDLKGEL